jgi:hypothetical protein
MRTSKGDSSLLLLQFHRFRMKVCMTGSAASMTRTEQQQQQQHALWRCVEMFMAARVVWNYRLGCGV